MNIVAFQRDASLLSHPSFQHITDIRFQAAEQHGECERDIHRQYIFCIDCSGSMDDSMDDVKHTLLAFRDVSVGCIGRQATSVDDERFQQTKDVTLITFNHEAKTLWTSKAPLISFTDAVMGIQAEHTTNMGDALVMSFQHVNENADLCSIILMTDGISNCGPCMYVNEFASLVSQYKKVNTAMYTLGYGTKYDVKTLKAIGEFVHVPDQESISLVMGGIVGEVESMFGLHGHVVPDGVQPVVGHSVMNLLYAGRRYRMFYPSLIDTIRFRYYDILSKTDKEVQVVSRQGDDMSNDDVTLFFDSEKERIIDMVSTMKQRRASRADVLSYIHQKTQWWRGTIAEQVKQTIIRDMLEMTFYEMQSMVSDAGRQVSYVRRLGLTPVQQSASQAMTMQSQLYD